MGEVQMQEVGSRIVLENCNDNIKMQNNTSQQQTNFQKCCLHFQSLTL